MEDNVALGIRISVTIVLVASLVATVLTLTVIGQSILGSGQNKLQTGLTQIQQQDLMQYANVMKKGSVVKSVINLYQGEPVAILVKTTALWTSPDGDNEDAKTVPTSGQGLYFNYGCLLSAANNNSQPAWSQEEFTDTSKHILVDAGTGAATSPIRTLDGQSHLEGGLQIVNGIKQTNYDTSGTVSIGNAESILDNGLFYCQLMKDVTGEIIGVVFTQQA